MITVLAQKTRPPYTIQVFNFADTWTVDSEPAPTSWRTIVYRVLKNGNRITQFPEKIAQIGSEMVETYTTQPALLGPKTP